MPRTSHFSYVCQIQSVCQYLTTNKLGPKLISKKLENNHIFSSFSITNTVNDINSIGQVDALWKWFIIFAIVFIIIELLILKYFK